MKIDFKQCKSCGIPMLHDKDFGGENPKNDWCKNCCTHNGSHKTYEEILEEMTNLILTEEGEEISGIKHESYEDAKKSTIKYLSKMEAFKE